MNFLCFYDYSKKELRTIDTGMMVLSNLPGSQEEHNSLEPLRSPMQMTFLRISSHILDSTKMTIHFSQISLEIKEVDSNSSNHHNQAEATMDLVVLEALEASVDLVDQAIITTCLQDLADLAVPTTCLAGLEEQTTISSVI